MTLARFYAYDTHQQFTCDRNISRMTRRKRFTFCSAVRQTFAALRMRSATSRRHNADFFNRTKRAVRARMDKWMRDSMQDVRECYPFGEPWVLVLSSMLGEDDAALQYLMANINCESPILSDVSQVLGNLSRLRPTQLRCKFTPCMISCTRPPYVEQRTAAGWADWCNTVAAEAIAETSFAVGWERELKAIASGFAAEIQRRAPPQREVLTRFLACVEQKLDAARAKHVALNVAAHIALTRRGIGNLDLRRMIVPPSRDGGMPLALLPRYLRL